MEKKTEQPTHTQLRIDPARAVDCLVMDGEAEVVLIFRRPVFVPDGDNMQVEIMPSAAVAMPWAQAIALRDTIDARIAAREAAKQGAAQNPAEARLN